MASSSSSSQRRSIIVLDDDDDDDENGTSFTTTATTTSSTEGDKGASRESKYKSFHSQDFSNFDFTKESTLYTNPATPTSSLPPLSKYDIDEEYSDLEDIFGRDTPKKKRNEDDNSLHQNIDTPNSLNKASIVIDENENSPDTELDDFLPVARTRKPSGGSSKTGNSDSAIVIPEKRNSGGNNSAGSLIPSKIQKIDNRPTPVASVCDEILRMRGEAVLSAPVLSRSPSPPSAGRSYIMSDARPEKSPKRSHESGKHHRHSSKHRNDRNDGRSSEKASDDEGEMTYTQQPKIASKDSEYFCDICGKDLSGESIKARMSHLSSHKKDSDIMGAIVAQRVAKNTAGDKAIARSNSILSRYFNHSITDDSAKKKHKRTKKSTYTKKKQTEDLVPKTLEEEELMVAQALAESSLDGPPGQKFDLAGFPISSTSTTSNRGSEHFAVKARKLFGERTNSLISPDNDASVGKAPTPTTVFSESALLKKFNVIGKPSLWNEASFRKEGSDDDIDRDNANSNDTDLPYSSNADDMSRDDNIDDNDSKSRQAFPTDDFHQEENDGGISDVDDDSEKRGDKSDDDGEVERDKSGDNDVDNDEIKDNGIDEIKGPDNCEEIIDDNDEKYNENEDRMGVGNENDYSCDDVVFNYYGENEEKGYEQGRESDGHSKSEREPQTPKLSSSPIVISLPSRSQSPSQKSSQHSSQPPPPVQDVRQAESSPAVLTTKPVPQDVTPHGDFVPSDPAGIIQCLREEKERIVNEIRMEADAAVERIRNALETALATLRCAQIPAPEDILYDDMTLSSNLSNDGDWGCPPAYNDTSVVDLVDDDDDDDNSNSGNNSNSSSSSSTAVLDEYMAKLNGLGRRAASDSAIISNYSNSSNDGFRDDRMGTNNNTENEDGADDGDDDDEDDENGDGDGNELNRDALEFMTKDRLSEYVKSYGMKPGTRSGMVKTLKSVRKRQSEKGITEIFSKTISQEIARCIKADETVYSRILLYEGVSVKAVKERLKSYWGVKVPEKILKNYFQVEAVVFTK